MTLTCDKPLEGVLPLPTQNEEHIAREKCKLKWMSSRKNSVRNVRRPSCRIYSKRGIRKASVSICQCSSCRRYASCQFPGVVLTTPTQCPNSKNAQPNRRRKARTHPFDFVSGLRLPAPKLRRLGPIAERRRSRGRTEVIKAYVSLWTVLFSTVTRDVQV